MFRVACRRCGRRLEMAVALDALPRDERRCPRCGSPLDVDRRVGQRRAATSQVNDRADPGPPDGRERRLAERRTDDRRSDRVGWWSVAVAEPELIAAG